jgi:thiol-disulfide isomerase/thioredoxin
LLGHLQPIFTRKFAAWQAYAGGRRVGPVEQLPENWVTAFRVDTWADAAEYSCVIPLFVLLQFAVPHAVVIGSHVPETSFVGVDGKPVVLSIGQTAVVDFFAIWCEPCHEALADLLAVSDADPGFVLVFVAVGEEAGKVDAFAKARGIPKKVVVAIDANAAIARAWGQDRFPTTFLVDKNGIVRHINRGYGGGFRARIERWLRDMR